MLLIGMVALALPALPDTGDSASASLIIIGVPEEVQTSPEVAGGGGGAAECQPLCPPPIPALYASKRADLAEDINGNGLVDPGDSLRYTMVVTNFAPVPMSGVNYVEVIDPHVRIVPDSWKVTRGNVTMREFDGTEVFDYLLGSLDANESVVFSFEVRVPDDLDLGVNELVGQGMVYADTTSPIVTDDPDTVFLQDATRTPIGGAAPVILASGSGGASAREPASGVIKEVNTALNPDIVRVVNKPDETVEYEVGFVNTTAQTLTGVRVVDLVGPHMSVQTGSLTPGGRVWQFGALQVVIADFDQLEPGETATFSYHAQVDGNVPAEIGYVASRAVGSSRNGSVQLSDDPLTKLPNDPTAVLFPYQCVGDGGWTWDDWLKVVSQAPAGLLPLVMQEEDGSQHLRWVLYGGDSFGDLSPRLPVRSPQWSLAGLVKVPFPSARDSSLGFRLAQRKGPHVEGVLSEEPFFLWIKYGMPLYGRMPAPDTGKLLSCTGFNSDFCNQGYLPLVVQLNRSEDLDVRSLKDELIVATVSKGRP